MEFIQQLKQNGLEKKKTIEEVISSSLGIEKKDIEKINLLNAQNLSDYYKLEYMTLQDKRLENVVFAIVPDELWVKGIQPSESSAENQLIIIKKSYFESQQNPDEIAWLVHEFAHCQNFLDSNSPEDYRKKSETFAFDDLKTNDSYPYPNNKVEQYTFTKQFQFLKEQDKSKEDILIMLSQYYKEENMPFFNRLLDNIYK